MIQIAVLGYGTVGSGVVEVIETNKTDINKKAAEDLAVKYILDLRDFPGDPYESKVVHDYNMILNDPEVKIICETMGGTKPAYDFTKQALLLGKSVCTSNKELVAAHGPELIKIAKENHCNYLFEASVGGGIPIIRPLNYSLTAEHIDSITGILNGTTNYSLTKMDREGADFEDVLKEAQDKGYAE
ncbi:MAG: homoserine dehydrogenase, partial [Lachnospiraceae bacterium]|nr:homoserine dehydrogenase [Lachnospiraceae bacterium]